jgi:hypothetical protein
MHLPIVPMISEYGYKYDVRGGDSDATSDDGTHHKQCSTIKSRSAHNNAVIHIPCVQNHKNSFLSVRMVMMMTSGACTQKTNKITKQTYACKHSVTRTRTHTHTHLDDLPFLLEFLLTSIQPCELVDIVLIFSSNFYVDLFFYRCDHHLWGCVLV